MRIAIDGMGGDNAPAAVVSGAVQAAREYGFEVVVVGKEELLEVQLARFKPRPAGVTIRHASEIIAMDESPVTGIRRKRDSSVNVIVELVREKQVDAMVSAGNTGAVVCATTLGLGLLAGVERAGIAIVFPALKGVSMLIDVGANIGAKPEHLLQYSIMGDVYSKYLLKKSSPTIGLLSVGEEPTKGTDFVKETHRLLSLSKLNFIGNVEGRDIFTGECDVIVCDGFIGNVILKVSEGIAEAFAHFLRRHMSKNILTRIGAIFSIPAFSGLKKEIDYAEYGGAPLLGVDGICIIGHGRSNAKAIKNAIRVAGEFVRHQVNQHIVEAIREF